MLWRDTVFLLGVPVDRVTQGEALGRVFALIAAYTDDRRPKLAASVNAGYLVEALSCWRATPRHPELLHCLQQADLVTAETLPVVWLSRLLATALPEAISMAEFVPALALEAARRKRSLYLLGPTREIAEAAAAWLRNEEPGLSIAGVDSPFVHTEGGDLADVRLEDKPICDRINDSGADLLLLGFGSPQQEMWFQRNRQFLTVPLTLTVGQALHALAAQRPQHPGQPTSVPDGSRSLWRSAANAVKFALLAAPPVLLYPERPFRSLTARAVTRERANVQTSDYRGDNRVVHWIDFPPRFVLPVMEECSAGIVEKASPGHAVVLNLQSVRELDASGLGFLVSIHSLAAQRCMAFYCVGLSPQLVRFLKVNRAWDLFSTTQLESFRDLVMRLEGRWGENLRLSAEVNAGNVRIHRLLGRLEAPIVPEVEALVDTAARSPSHCILDFTGCVFVDSSGLGFCVRLLKAQQRTGHRLILSGLAAEPRQLLQIVKLTKLFHIEDTLEAAQKQFAPTATDPTAVPAANQVPPA